MREKGYCYILAWVNQNNTKQCNRLEFKKTDKGQERAGCMLIRDINGNSKKIRTDWSHCRIRSPRWCPLDKE